MVHLSLSVLEGEGVALSEEYRAGVYYPVFILTNSAGEVITRWTGYTGADRFLQSFAQAKSNLTTMTARAGRFDAKPTEPDALALAKYYADTREHLKSRNYYRRLQALQGDRTDYSYQIFKATAEAVWNDLVRFDSLAPAADAVLASGRKNQSNLGQMAQITANVARRTGDTDKIEKYLQAGINATAARKDENGINLHRDLLADYALYVTEDPAKAVDVKKRALGKGWAADPARYFKYAEFCFQRKLNLVEAEHYARLAASKASDGKFKARHQRLLAEILFALGRVAQAIEVGEEAMEQEPTAVYFEDKLNEWRQ